MTFEQERADTPPPVFLVSADDKGLTGVTVIGRLGRCRFERSCGEEKSVTGVEVTKGGGMARRNHNAC